MSDALWSGYHFTSDSLYPEDLHGSTCWFSRRHVSRLKTSLIAAQPRWFFSDFPPLDLWFAILVGLNLVLLWWWMKTRTRLDLGPLRSEELWADNGLEGTVSITISSTKWSNFDYFIWLISLRLSGFQTSFRFTGVDGFRGTENAEAVLTLMFGSKRTQIVSCWSSVHLYFHESVSAPGC